MNLEKEIARTKESLNATFKTVLQDLKSNENSNNADLYQIYETVKKCFDTMQIIHAKQCQEYKLDKTYFDLQKIQIERADQSLFINIDFYDFDRNGAFHANSALIQLWLVNNDIRYKVLSYDKKNRLEHDYYTMACTENFFCDMLNLFVNEIF